MTDDELAAFLDNMLFSVGEVANCKSISEVLLTLSVSSRMWEIPSQHVASLY